MYNEDEFIKFLRDRIRETGSQKEFARQHKTHGSTVSNVLIGDRKPPKSLLDSLNYVRENVNETVYKPKG